MNPASSSEFIRRKLFPQRQIPAFDPVNMLRITRAPLLQGNRLEAATEFGAHAGLFRQRPDIVAHLQTMKAFTMAASQGSAEAAATCVASIKSASQTALRSVLGNADRPIRPIHVDRRKDGASPFQA